MHVKKNNVSESRLSALGDLNILPPPEGKLHHLPRETSLACVYIGLASNGDICNSD